MCLFMHALSLELLCERLPLPDYYKVKKLMMIVIIMTITVIIEE